MNYRRCKAPEIAKAHGINPGWCSVCPHAKIHKWCSDCDKDCYISLSSNLRSLDDIDTSQRIWVWVEEEEISKEEVVILRLEGEKIETIKEHGYYYRARNVLVETIKVGMF